jgi:hypothetical protein
MKEGDMKRKAIISLLSLMFFATGLILVSCAGVQTKPATATKIQSVLVNVESVDRLNAIAPKPPYQGTDTLVFRVNFKLTNPNNVIAKVDNLYFEVKVEDGTPDKTIICADSMPNALIPAGGEISWSWTGPYLYGATIGSYALRGVGGEGGLKGVVGRVAELWTDLGNDKRKFFVDGNITTSLPDCPELKTVYKQFKAEFNVPSL